MRHLIVGWKLSAVFPQNTGIGWWRLLYTDVHQGGDRSITLLGIIIMHIIIFTLSVTFYMKNFSFIHFFTCRELLMQRIVFSIK